MTTTVIEQTDAFPSDGGLLKPEDLGDNVVDKLSSLKVRSIQPLDSSRQCPVTCNTMSTASYADPIPILFPNATSATTSAATSGLPLPFGIEDFEFCTSPSLTPSPEPGHRPEVQPFVGSAFEWPPPFPFGMEDYNTPSSPLRSDNPIFMDVDPEPAPILAPRSDKPTPPIDPSQPDIPPTHMEVARPDEDMKVDPPADPGPPLPNAIQSASVAKPELTRIWTAVYRIHMPTKMKARLRQWQACTQLLKNEAIKMVNKANWTLALSRQKLHDLPHGFTTHCYSSRHAHRAVISVCVLKSGQIKLIECESL